MSNSEPPTRGLGVGHGNENGGDVASSCPPPPASLPAHQPPQLPAGTQRMCEIQSWTFMVALRGTRLSSLSDLRSFQIELVPPVAVNSQRFVCVLPYQQKKTVRKGCFEGGPLDFFGSPASYMYAAFPLLAQWVFAASPRGPGRGRRVADERRPRGWGSEASLFLVCLQCSAAPSRGV